MTFPSIRLLRRPPASADSLLGHSGTETLRFPLPAPSRIAVIGTAFRLTPNMREFSPEDLAGLQDYDPEALVLPTDLALPLAETKQRGLLDLPSLKRALVVLWSFDTRPLTPHQRDLLWAAFLLPVFEQLRGWDGKVVARECEVHDGLHLDSQRPDLELPAGLRGELAEEPCDCGLETPRLKNLRALKARVAAA